MASLLDLFPSSTTTFDKSGTKTETTQGKNIIQMLYELLFPQTIEPWKPSSTQPTTQPVQQVLAAETASPQPMPVQTPQQVSPQTMDEVERKIRAGFKEYARLYNQGQAVPAEKFIPQFVAAAQKYDFFKKNPYLLPQISILETSGGKHITRPNNLINWGINVPGNNQAFAGMTPEQVLEIGISGLGERSPYYEDIRKNNDLKKFAQTYEPANSSYYDNLMKGIEFFQNQP